MLAVIACVPACRRGRVPNFNFTFTLNNRDVWDITFTAVRGHVMEHVFPDACKSWQKYPMKQLFETPVNKQVSNVCIHARPSGEIVSKCQLSNVSVICNGMCHIPGVIQGNQDVADNLQHQTRGKDLLVLWLDCDREGEAIGFEVRSAAPRQSVVLFFTGWEMKVSANNVSCNEQSRTSGGTGTRGWPCLEDCRMTAAALVNSVSCR